MAKGLRVCPPRAFPVFKGMPSAFVSGFVVFLPLGVHGKPAALHALVLREDFAYAPEGGESGNAEEDAEQLMMAAEAEKGEYEAHHEEGPPAATAEVVLGPDDKGMEEADDEKGGQAKEDSGIVHFEGFLWITNIVCTAPRTKR